MFKKVLYPIVVLSILASQCTWTGTNPTYGPAELLQHLKLSGSSYIVTSPELLHVVDSAVGDLDRAVDVILLTDILKDPPLDQGKGCQKDLATLHSLMRMVMILSQLKISAQVSSDTDQNLHLLEASFFLKPLALQVNL